MNFLYQGESHLYTETNIDAGTIGFWGGKVNNAFDLHVVRTGQGSYRLIIYMELQFFFDVEENHLNWSVAEQDQFIEAFKTNVNARWGNNRPLAILPSNIKVDLDCRFNVTKGGTSWAEHWEVHVLKTNRPFIPSRVSWLTGHVKLDSKDIYLTPPEYLPRGRQRGIIHEFGHMLGLEDEYPRTSSYYHDLCSVMHSGEYVYPRHHHVALRWLYEAHLAGYC